MKNWYLYILMRVDLPSMGTGRVAAQASHAANAFIHKYGNNATVKEWSAETNQGFGTAIVLGVTQEQLRDVNAKAKGLKLPSELVIDPDYVIPISSEIVNFIDKDNEDLTIERSQTDPSKFFLHRSEITCGYIFGDKEELKNIVGLLPLYS